VPRNIEDIIYAAHQPIIAVFVNPCSVAGKYFPGNLEIDFFHPLVFRIAMVPDHSPGLIDYQIAPSLTAAGDRLPEQLGNNTRKRPVGGTGPKVIAPGRG
jgi:hypothetical protein